MQLKTGKSLLPRALLVAVCLQPLAALVLRHFKTTFLLQITHGIVCVAVCYVVCGAACSEMRCNAAKKFQKCKNCIASPPL